MIKINQDILCEYCEWIFEINRNSCEGSRCSLATERYFEDKGIIKDEHSCFGDLKCGDKLYTVDKAYRTIKKIEITSISFDIKDKDILVIGYAEGKGFVQKKSLKDGMYFLHKSDAIDEFKNVIAETVLKMSEQIAKLL